MIQVQVSVDYPRRKDTAGHVQKDLRLTTPQEKIATPRPLLALALYLARGNSLEDYLIHSKKIKPLRQ